MKNYSKQLIMLCYANNITISLAESCTGGLMSSFLISIPRASKVINLGLVTYSNSSKVKFLNVSNYILKKYGAVSKNTATSMVKGLIKRINSDIYMGITGIAGPDGGTITKPVGLVYHSFYFKKKDKHIVIEKNYNGPRNKIRKDAAFFSISYTYKFLASII